MNQVINENQYKESNSIVLDLESLSARYKMLLVVYKQAVLDYINYLQEEIQQNSNVNQQKMMAIPGYDYWGTNALSTNNSATINVCKASCANTPGCTGATFNPNFNGQPLCSLRSGESDVIPSSENHYAIVSKGQYLLSMIKNINQQLYDINQQIQTKSNIGQPLYDEASQEGKIKTGELIRQFIQLTQERNKIDEMLKNYKKLDQEQVEGNIMINQNYYSFILLLGLAILSIIILYKFTGFKTETTITPPIAVPSIQSGGELGINAYYIVFGIIIVTLIISLYNKFLNKSLFSLKF
jgi:hypothetical protein